MLTIANFCASGCGKSQQRSIPSSRTSYAEGKRPSGCRTSAPRAARFQTLYDALEKLPTKTRRISVRAPERPPLVSAALPVWLVERHSRNDAALPVHPGLLERRCRGDLFETRVVGRVRQLRRLGKPRHQAPLSNDEFALAVRRMRRSPDEGTRHPGKDRSWRKVDLGTTRFPELSDVGGPRRQVAVAHGFNAKDGCYFRTDLR